MITIAENTLNSLNRKPSLFDEIVDVAKDISTVKDFDTSKVVPSTLLMESFSDSLEFHEFIFELEERFDVNIPITTDTKYFINILQPLIKEMGKKCQES